VECEIEQKHHRSIMGAKGVNVQGITQEFSVLQVQKITRSWKMGPWRRRGKQERAGLDQIPGT